MQEELDMKDSQKDQKTAVDYLGSLTQLVVEEKIVSLIDSIDKALEEFGCPDISRVKSVRDENWFNKSKRNVLDILRSENPGANLPEWLWVQCQTEIFSGIENQMSNNPEPDLNKYSAFLPSSYSKLDFKCSLEMESGEVLKSNVIAGAGNIPGCISGMAVVVSEIKIEGRDSPPTFTVDEWRRISNAVLAEHLELEKKTRDKFKSKL